MSQPSGIDWNSPTLSERNTPWDYSAAWLRTWLLDYMTPSYLAATVTNDVCEFLDIATQEWLKRYPTDVLPGNPRAALFRHHCYVEKLQAELEEIFSDSSDSKGFEEQRDVPDEFDCGEVRQIDAYWKDELPIALQVYDVEFPLTGPTEWSMLTLVETPKYSTFTSRTPDQLQEDFLWLYRDPDEFIVDYDLAFAQILAAFRG
ncbi:hypothetical protein K435DRAFT_861798 [Dendrothele bispora CBS 962.96]|uniref:Uncharacterized protein n=1 Tax=Dendrothele bispora (strain CBS 962.96) TaxID=1314807 RepID=A0A4S8LU52_DENBC|nr:hypothetical protein K435DRAFT_861798 [Dendrothele bispora CBS 962.96]